MSEPLYVRLPDSADPARIRPVYGMIGQSRAELIVPNDSGRLDYYEPRQCVAVTAVVAPCERCGVPQEVRDLHTTDDGLLLCAGCEAPAVEQARRVPAENQS